MIKIDFSYKKYLSEKDNFLDTTAFWTLMASPLALILAITLLLMGFFITSITMLIVSIVFLVFSLTVYARIRLAVINKKQELLKEQNRLIMQEAAELKKSVYQWPKIETK